MGCIIAGCGKALPALEVTNDDLTALVDTSDEWITERTGIRSRRIAVNESATDLAAAAAARALGWSESAHAECPGVGWTRLPEAVEAASVDLLICMTITPDAVIPSQAALVKARLGLENAVAFDLNAACSGCVYGLAVAESMLRAANETPLGVAHNGFKRALVVGVERLSRLVNWNDRATCVLFGDGAGAVLLEWQPEHAGIMASFLKNTDDTNLLLSTENRLSDDTLPFPLPRENDQASGMERGGTCATLALGPEHFINMEGQAVFKFATSALAEAVRVVLERGGIALAEVDLIVPHQANERIIRYAAKKLGLSMERFQVSIEHTGNTSAASALMALADAYAERRLAPGRTAVMAGFGGGLTAGALLFEA